MKNKTVQLGVILIGIAAAVVRGLERWLTIGEDGYYLAGPLAVVLKWALIGLLFAGTLWCIFGNWGRKEQVDGESLFGSGRLHRFYFAVLGLLAAVEGAFYWMEATSTLMKIGGGLLAAGALGWLALAFFPKKAGLLVMLPTLQFAAKIIIYFWATYKEVYVSANVLGMLGWCVGLYFVHSLCKVLAGAACSKGRLATACGLVILYLFAAFLVSDPGDSLHYAYGIMLLPLAAEVLKGLGRKPAEPALPESPDLSFLDEYVDSIPEVEEE